MVRIHSATVQVDPDATVKVDYRQLRVSAPVDPRVQSRYSQTISWSRQMAVNNVVFTTANVRDIYPKKWTSVVGCCLLN